MQSINCINYTVYWIEQNLYECVSVRFFPIQIRSRNTSMKQARIENEHDIWMNDIFLEMFYL